jgi:outer membrane beta-barrel protein
MKGEARMMLRIYPSILLVALMAFGWPALASAANDDDDEMSFDPVDVPKKGQPAAEPEIEIEGEEPEPDLASDLSATEPVKGDEDIQLAENRVSWQDIVVVVRKPFLKLNRVEVMPLVGITMNDNIIQHMQGGFMLNYWLTDALAVGVEGFAYVKNLREPFDLVARQARRLPTVNKYNFSAALDFHYVPIYGKFAVFDQLIVHWEVFFTAGVGATQSEVIPRDPALQPFTNILITPNVGASMRFFLTKFLTFNIGVRDYVFVDKFEAVNRVQVSGDEAKEFATSAFINNVMFQAGLSIWFPMSFEYTTFR